MNDNLSPADIKAVVGSNGYGNGFGGDGSWIWFILILALFGGWGGNGNGFGGYGNDFAWLSNGQKEIMSNTNDGFNTLHLSNQIEGVRDGIYGITNQICNSTADITSAISNGFYNSEISANNRQMANMQQNFDLSRQLADCCCENRLATCQTQNIVQNEANTTRFADANNTRDIITNATSNTQAILDKLCQLELDSKNTKIADLERQLTMADLRASQIAQTAQIRAGQVEEIDAMYDRLKNCPVGTVPVYGSQPIFTCPGSGCGCGNVYGNTIV